MSKNKAQVNEGVLDDMDEDGWMAKSQLYQAAKYAIELHKMIQDTDNLEPWVQSKISKAADYLSSIKHYMEYESVNSYPGEETEEAPVEIEQQPMVAPIEVDEDEVVDEAMESDEVMAILQKHPQDVARMKRDGDINTASGLYTALYHYYSDEMPYGTQKARDGDPVEWIMNKLDDMGMLESQIDEGYEGEVSAILQALDIEHHWQDGRLHVNQRDVDDVKNRLADTDMEMPKIVAEKGEETIGSDTDDLWMEKLAAAGLKSATEGRMSDISAAADEVATMIEGGATDQEIMDHTGLNDSQVKFLRDSLQDRAGQYDEGHSPHKKGTPEYKKHMAAMHAK